MTFQPSVEKLTKDGSIFESCSIVFKSCNPARYRWRSLTSYPPGAPPREPTEGTPTEKSEPEVEKEEEEEKDEGYVFSECTKAARDCDLDTDCKKVKLLVLCSFLSTGHGSDVFT